MNGLAALGEGLFYLYDRASNHVPVPLIQNVNRLGIVSLNLLSAVVVKNNGVVNNLEVVARLIDLYRITKEPDKQRRFGLALISGLGIFATLSQQLGLNLQYRTVINAARLAAQLYALKKNSTTEPLTPWELLQTKPVAEIKEVPEKNVNRLPFINAFPVVQLLIT